MSASHRTNHAAKPSGLVKAGDRPADVVAFEEALVSFFTDAADNLGVPKSVAAIYGICFASPEPLSFSDINERLDISSGSVSQGLKVLREVGALRVAETPSELSAIRSKLLGRSPVSARAMTDSEPDAGKSAPTTNNQEPTTTTRSGVTNNEEPITSARSAAARYEPDLKARKLVSTWLDQRLRQQLDAGRSRLGTILETMPPEHGKEECVVRGRIEHLQSWHDKASAVLPMVKIFLRL